MRHHGSRATLAGLGCQAHGCLVYDDDGTFLAEGERFLRDGLDLGQRAMYVGSAPLEDLRAHVAGLGDVDALVRDGRLVLLTVGDAYDVRGLDPAAQAARYGAAIDAALRDGFTGLRTLAEISPLLATAQGADRIVRWEAEADRIMAERPWAALCCYDRRRVPAEALADVASVHPLACGADDLTSLRVFSAGTGRMALGGSLDTFAAPALDRLLALAAPGRPFELDLSTLDFADHNGVLALARCAEAGGAPVAVSGAPPLVRKVAALLGVAL